MASQYARIPPQSGGAATFTTVVATTSASSPAFIITGATSGSLTVTVPAVTTTYAVVMPGAQGAANTFLKNDGAGNLSWAAAGGATTWGSITGASAQAAPSGGFTGNVFTTGTINPPAGTAALPSLYLDGDTTTGFYRRGLNQLGITTSGTGSWYFNSDGTLYPETNGANFLGDSSHLLQQVYSEFLQASVRVQTYGLRDYGGSHGSPTSAINVGANLLDEDGNSVYLGANGTYNQPFKGLLIGTGGGIDIGAPVSAFVAPLYQLTITGTGKVFGARTDGGFTIGASSTTGRPDTIWVKTLLSTGAEQLGRGTSAGTATITAGVVFWGVTGTAGGTITTPTAAAVGNGGILMIKDEGGGATLSPITITAGSGTIDGTATITILINYGVARIYSNGTNFFTF